MCQLMCDLHHAVYVEGDPNHPQLSDVLLFPFLYFTRQLRQSWPFGNPWQTVAAGSSATAVGHTRWRRITLIDGSLPAGVLADVVQRLFAKTSEAPPGCVWDVKLFTGAAFEFTQTSRTLAQNAPVIEHVKVTHVARDGTSCDSAALAARLPGAGWLAVTAWHDVIDSDRAYDQEGIKAAIGDNREGVFHDGWFAWGGLRAVLEEVGTVCCRPGTKAETAC